MGCSDGDCVIVVVVVGSWLVVESVFSTGASEYTVVISTLSSA